LPRRSPAASPAAPADRRSLRRQPKRSPHAPGVSPMPFRSATSTVAAPVDNWIHSRVLVLNASYEALDEITADRAVVLLISGAAEAVAHREPYVPIRSQRLEIALPQTIRLLRYVFLEHAVAVRDDSRATLAGVLRRDSNRCGYCADW